MCDLIEKVNGYQILGKHVLFLDWSKCTGT